tara:strand:+ start:236 stop:763 length:528 start_codon:yes stop_codon:yes gene_type:complete
MPRGKGTYGSKVGRPSGKKKLQKAQAGKAANAGKILKKAQPGIIAGAAPAVGSAYDSALRALGLGKGKGAAGAGAGAFKKAISSLGKAALQQKKLNDAKKKAAIMSATGQFDSGSDNLMELEMLAGKTLDGTIVDNFEGKRGIIEDSPSQEVKRKGGSVTHAKSYRSSRKSNRTY